MDLSSRKIEFVQEFLKLKNEEAISRLEKALKQETNKTGEDLEPMTEDELNKGIDKSEADFNNNRYKKSSDLLSKYK